MLQTAPFLIWRNPHLQYKFRNICAEGARNLPMRNVSQFINRAKGASFLLFKESQTACFLHICSIFFFDRKMLLDFFMEVEVLARYFFWDLCNPPINNQMVHPLGCMDLVQALYYKWNISISKNNWLLQLQNIYLNK